MNSYNENLNSVVVTSLQSQSLDEKSIYSKQNASMFTLYYAEGATISAEEKLEAAKDKMKVKLQTKTEAVRNTNLSNNLLASATQANQYFKQSINNMAVCAANVQIATNAIVKLASDMGSIYSIVHAADRNSDIFKDTEKVRSLIDNTAYAAELASKLAMDASTYTSEVSVSTVLDKSKSANIAINNLLSIASKDFDNILTEVHTDNSTLADVSAKQKLAEGVLEDTSIDYKATKRAYNSTNEELNLDLWVELVSGTNYQITFNGIENPFSDEQTVQNYHLIIVKESKKAIFSISNAEGIRIASTNPQKQYIEVTDLGNGKLEKVIDFMRYPYPHLLGSSPAVDSDGDELILGVNYVVFVMAVYTDYYKREINNFDDFLSAPSRSFTLTNTLHAVNDKDIHVIPLQSGRGKEDLKIELDFKISQNLELIADFDFSEKGPADYTNKLYFKTSSIDVKYKPEYYCMFLPVNTPLAGHMLTNSSLKLLMDKVANTVKDPEITIGVLTTHINNLNKELAENKKENDQVTGKLKDIANQLSAAPSDKNSKALLEDQAKYNLQLVELENANEEILIFITTAKQELENLENEKRNETNSYPLDFFFNVAIAEQVSAGNYTVAVPDTKRQEDHDPKDKTKKISGEAILLREKHWMAYIGAETTDNFGNLLIDGNDYCPVILTLSKERLKYPGNFTNAISFVNKKSIFTFKNPKN